MTAVRRLLLVRHAGTPATRHADFSGNESLTPAGALAAAALRPLAKGGDVVACSPSLRARETAAAAGWDAAPDERLAALDAGVWSGQALQQIGGTDPQGLVRWLADPGARPHGGETILELIARVRGLLTEWHDPLAPDLLAVTHGSVIRAAVVIALDAPPDAFWRVEAAPASATELHTRGAGWVLFRANAC